MRDCQPAPESPRTRLLRENPQALRKLSDRDLATLHYDWAFWARADQLPPAGDWRYWMILAGRGFGKLLALDTPVPTPAGWTTMGELQAGDCVFDEAGNVTRVTAAHPVTLPERAYVLTFDDGTQITAGGEHEWSTWTHRDRKQLQRYGRVDEFPKDWPAFEWNLYDSHLNVVGKYGPKVRNTDDLYKTQRIGARGDTNHSIPAIPGLQLPDAPLPVHPYVLGYWLANGSTKGGEVTTGSLRGDFDHDHVAQKFAEHYALSVNRLVPAKGQGRIAVRGLRAMLPGDKHIPAAYLRSSAAQRWELLRGLCDGDGHCSGPNAEYCTTSKKLAHGVAELLRTLGETPTLSAGRAMLNGVDHGTKYRIHWRPTQGNPFSLTRKAQRVPPRSSQALRTRQRMIVSIVPVEPMPMRCITVDSPHSLYLVSEGFIATHNSRTGAEWVRAMARQTPFITIIGATANDARTIMVEGESGILACCSTSERPRYMAHKGELHWPNGSKTQVMGAEEPERLRGKQHSTLWADELASWRYPETWDQAMLGLRLGHPRALITTTPRPTPIIRRLMADPHTALVRGSTYDNRANLAPEFMDAIIKRYEGTRLGRQELNAEILTDNPGALWQRDLIEASRVQEAPELIRTVIGVDPAATSGEESDMTGIVVCALGRDKRGYVLADYTLRASPADWARKVAWAAAEHKADRVVVEVNNGGDMCEAVLRHIAPNLPITKVRASHGKYARAEPIAALYEQGRVSHVGGFAALEDQLTDYVPGEGRRSPDRLDALVWALHHLMPPTGAGNYASAGGRTF